MTKEEYMQRLAESVINNDGCVTQTVKYGVFFTLLILLLSSCTPKTIVEYRERVVDHYITKEVHDTLVDKTTDSVFVNVYTKGDTVFLEKYKEKTRWRDRVVVKSDTCWRDSTTIINKETTKEVIKIPKIYRISLLFSILIIIFAFVKLVRYIQIH